MSDTLLGLLCFALTLLFYYASKWLYGKKRILPLMPLLLAPALLVAVVVLFHIPYQDYLAESHGLLWLLGPATVAFAVPVYENRQLIHRHWLSLSVGVVASVIMAVGIGFAVGATNYTIGQASRMEIGGILEQKVHLFLFVKVRENWGDDPERYREMGLEFPG